MKLNVNLENREKMEFFVDNCELKTPEEVARLFTEYTYLIWDHYLVGKIYDFYDDDVKLNHAGGLVIQGVANVFANTLTSVARNIRNKPNHTDIFVEIFAEGDEENGYRFIQACSSHDTTLGEYAPPAGRVMGDAQRGNVGLCECNVQKINGRWQIVEEWLVRAPSNPPTPE